MAGVGVHLLKREIATGQKDVNVSQGTRGKTSNKFYYVILVDHFCGTYPLS